MGFMICALLQMQPSTIDDKEVASLVAAYLGAPEDTALERLNRVRPNRLTKVLLPYLEKKDGVILERTLSLAGRMRVPGLSEKLKRFLDSPLEALAVKAMAADGPGSSFAYDRWLKAEVGTTAFTTVEAVLTSIDIGDPNLLNKFSSQLSAGEDRAKSAAAILCFQMNLPVKDPAVIAKSWPKLKSNFAKYTRPYLAQGTDLLTSEFVEVRASRRIGPNVRLSKGAELLVKPLPPKMQVGSHRIKVQVLPLSDGIAIDFRKLVGGRPFSWPIRLDQGSWLVRTGDSQDFRVACKYAEWTEVIFDVIDESVVENGVQRSNRSLSILVDGKAILERGQHAGELTELAFTAGDGDFVIGGIDWGPPEGQRLKR